ncbi:asparagine synthase-related protein [Aquibacillus rhizosphaerae]|uniref:asparagine synthase (glutamine-hydrolyzing) n=1 Tax=Aquibacillus rhizosphaerae TaxID=3051431 RepID=A0ABT7KZQ4_9BACI|nr:asparagine synthase-related protein [Aquibacillus sp. LR5S19]MDL4838973.1 asparagine synthase-related protein [Aquibacillus sp. LR5S19]
MSAIAGILHGDKQPVTPEQITNMMDAFSKFPADDIRVWHQSNLYLGCHAQWITPESVGEPVPYYDSERDLAITADAIIDNRQELFEMLQVDKEKRLLMPDSVLLLLAYIKWGENTPEHVIGDFAFMIWDGKKQKLFGARDFSGARTLYYCHQNQSFAFSTTIEPLLTLPFMKKHLNEEWLAQFLAITAVTHTLDSALTPYRNIYEIPPSHRISVVGQKVTINRYNTLTNKEKLHYKSNHDYIDAFQEIFQQAVDARLRTHRGVGAQLSGGLDSGSVTSFAAGTLKEQGKPLHTFSYIPPKDFEDFTPGYLIADERPYIQETVNHIGHITDHYCDFNESSPYSVMDELLHDMEMPYKFFENSFWLAKMFEEAQAKDIGILLSGDRGNLTISWGNALDYYTKLCKNMRWIKLVQEVHQHTLHLGGSRLKKLKMIRKHAFPSSKSAEAPADYILPQVINSQFATQTDVFTKLQDYGFDDTGWYGADQQDLRLKHFEDVCHWIPTNTVSTKLSLRHNVWKRDPTNDLRVIRFCLSLPDNQFVQDGYDRALIRRATEGYLPDKVRLNQRIRGVQGADWVHRMAPSWQLFVEEAEQLSKDDDVLQFINKQAINDALNVVKNGPCLDKDNDPHYRILMRSLIVYRFLKKFHLKEVK